MELKIGDIILSYERSIFSWIVSKFTRSKYSHSSLYLGNNEYISAIPFKNVCIRNISTIKHFDVYRVKDIDEQKILNIVEFCKERLDSKYDFLQVLILFYRKLTDKLKIYSNDPNDNKYVCSELISEAFASEGIIFNKYIENTFPGTISDSELIEFICSEKDLIPNDKNKKD